MLRRIAFLLVIALPLLAADPQVSDLAWMSGHWSSGSVEELWLEPKGDLMLGMSRTIGKSGKASFEFMRIAKTDNGIAYLAQPGGKPAVAFALVESTRGRVVFANPQHDFPKRITYELRDGKLCARVDDGKSDGDEWCWSRVP